MNIHKINNKIGFHCKQSAFLFAILQINRCQMLKNKLCLDIILRLREVQGSPIYLLNLLCTGNMNLFGK